MALIFTAGRAQGDTVGLMRLWSRRSSASSLDLLVAGLGNPGGRYERTRHNVGWLVIDELAARHEARFRGKFSGKLAELRLAGGRVALLKPETYMNESGRSIAAAMRFYKLASESLVVVHDDVDLDDGRLQLRSGGGLAGHNGLRSIAQAVGTQEFLRVRIGIGRPGRGDPRSIADFVLSSFEPDVNVGEIVARAADAVEAVAEDGLESAQRRFN